MSNRFQLKLFQMKKILILFFLFAIVLFANSQNKTNKLKAPFAKDSLKKDKLAIVQPPIVFNDSVISIKKENFKTFKINAHASYYADKFNGRKTASGKKFDNSKYTAAHRKFPFGTKLRITNQDNGKFVIVEVTDRGPFIKGREIDLSKKAFMEITSNKNSGTVTIKIEEEIK